MPAARWACLMYHSIPASLDDADYFAVPRAAFAAQLDRLAALGLAGCALESVLLQAPTPGGLRPVAITFDDGRADNFTEAFPELVARSMTATFFVITSRVGTPGYVSWEQLGEMRKAGMSIQSHTDTHPFLSELPGEDVSRELATSRRALDEKLSQRTTTLSLPNGDAPRGWTAGDFDRAGYRWVATSEYAPNGASSWRVGRYTVRRATTLDEFDHIVRNLPTALSAEGLRLRVLASVRTLLGVSRYARLRRRVLRALGR
jgi:peptidoglycan/xylan/chitin deacetylase (PgdA/CDA1 family)